MKNILKYNSPASAWEKGMPLGNGRIGAMLLGETKKEHIWLNEDTLWSGYPLDYNDENVYQYLEESRKLIFEKRYSEAEEIINKHMVGIWNESYMPMADLYLEMPELDGDVDVYSRRLDIGQALSSVVIEKNGIHYKRDTFCSHPDQVLVAKITCSEKIKECLKIKVSSQLKHKVLNNGNQIVLDGYCPIVAEPDYYPAKDPVIYDDYETTQAIKFRVAAQIMTDGGMEWKDDELIVSDAKEVLILLTSANSFIDFMQKPQGEYEGKAADILKKASSYSYEELYERHIADFKSLFDRVELDLGHTENEDLPMEIRQQKMFDGDEDPELIATAFQFGRYLLITGSREGTQPTNLQGIWSNEVRPPWSSNYTVNLNTQMNYWPAEVCNLADCVEPLVEFIKDISIAGKETASINYHCRGWVVHHNIDLWRKTTAVGSRNKEIDVLPWSYWVMAGGWFCQHLWERYRFNQDHAYLKETAYPIMKECARFYLDFLVEYQGKMFIVPSSSPENLFIDGGETHGMTYGSTMDHAVLRELFENCMQAFGVTEDTDQTFLEEMERAYHKLPEYKIGKYGQLQEWYEDFEEKDPKHRHLSHLYGLYPGDSITVEKNPELIQACKVTLKRRGEGSVPWSRGWKVAMQARLKDGEKAYDEVKKFLQPADSNEISYDDGGVYLNLFCARPLEVDGNFAYTAGIAEMLVQSHTDEVQYLPALPKEWKDGYVRGLRIRGNKEVEIEWKDGKIVNTKVMP